MSKMPILLAVDTHHHFLTIALQASEGSRKTFKDSEKNRHSEHLLPRIYDLLKQAELKPQDVDLWAVVRGVGSYTGIRIGLSAIRTLAYCTEKPCVGVLATDLKKSNLLDLVQKLWENKDFPSLEELTPVYE